MAAKQLDYTPDPNKFDRRTHVWDAYGNLVKTNLYRTYIVSGREVMERPVNSGNLWDEANQPAGRVDCKFNEKGHIASKEFHFDAPHIVYTAPLSGAEKLHYENEQLKKQLEATQAEIAAIKADQSKKVAVAVTGMAEPTQVEAPPTLKKGVK